MMEINQLFEQFNGLNVLVVGDVMIDRYLKGSVDRISPEAPVPVVHLSDSDNRLGGAANVALNLKALGATPYLCSVIGKDENAEVFLNLLPENQLSTRGIVQSSERVTTVKTRVIANNQHLLRVDREDTHDLSSKEEEAYLNNIRDLLESKEFHVILFQDYNKGVLSYSVIRGIILDAIKRDIPTAVDPKYKNFWAYKHVTLFKPNLKEIRAQLEQSVAINMTDLTEASSRIKSKLGNQLTMITLSEKGLFIEDDKKYTDVVPTQERTIADVCGAGDTVISVTSLCLALGIDPKEIAVLANLAGGQVCEKVGVVPVDKEQLRQEYVSLQSKKINQ
ncbi:MAG: bifunctional ADP-heptose synthase [Saprospiraceae bacterium]|nr:bifunctional ADP-heptose synthase [Saprospiraceae bacterium]